MKYPFGLELCQKHFRKLGFQRKRMTACAISGGTIILGANKFKSHPKSKSRENRVHCELNVLNRLTKSDQYVRIFTYREDSQGNPRLARPCSDCITLLRSAGITKITYSTNNGFAKERII